MTDHSEDAEITHKAHHHHVTVLADLTVEPMDELERTLSCRECGLRLLGLVISSPEWVSRRVESVTFRDHRTVRRRVSVDFSVPIAAPLLTINSTSYRLVPLTIMRRKSLVNFDLRDESDASVPLLGIRQNQSVTLALLDAWAGAVMGLEETSQSVRRFLENLVSGTQEELIHACRLAESPDAPPDIKCLVDDKRFKHVMQRVTEDFVLFTLVREDGPARRIYKFRYDEPLSRQYRESGSRENQYRRFPPPISRWAREPLMAALGWAPTRIRFPTPAAENARSYHFEVHAPAGVAIDSAKILAGRPDEDRTKRPPSVDHVTGGFPTVDLHVVDVERGSLSRAQVDLRLAADSWLFLAAASAWLTAIALVWAANRLGQFGDRDNDTASALFITLTVALAAILWRPPEHRMAVRLLSRVGLLAYTSCLFLLVAAALFVFDREGRLTVGLTTLAVLSTVVAIALTITVVRVRGSASEDKVLSPWEQGRRVAEELDGEGARHDNGAYSTFGDASQRLGFKTPAVKVASAEADSAATLILDDDLVRDMRSLVARRLSTG